jgi:hypothetical protein
MDEAVTVETETQDRVKVSAAIDEIFEEIGRLNDQMRRRQSEIDRLKEETRAILADLHVAS